ncbi:MAG: hypothetical protein ACT4P0_04210 [Panacagrimonas sp.]
MNTMFLSADEIAQVDSIMADHGITGFDACVRLWGRGKTIHVSGDVHKGDLACLLAIARYLNDEPGGERSTVADQAPVALIGTQMGEAGAVPGSLV